MGESRHSTEEERYIEKPRPFLSSLLVRSFLFILFVEFHRMSARTEEHLIKRIPRKQRKGATRQHTRKG